MIKVIAIGKNKDKALRSLEDEYKKRTSAFSKIEVIEVKDESNERAESEKEVEKIKEKEGERALEKIKDSDYVILLDLHGTMESSESFAKQIDRLQSSSKPITFVIAGSLGPSKKLVDRANYRLKISDMTFTHLMTRALLLEQIYRAFSILNNRSYHK